MALKVGELFGELKLDSGHFDRGLSRAQGAMGGMQKALRAGVLAGAAAGVALGGVALKIGSDFNDAFNTIRVGTGATGDALDGLKDDFRAVARDVPDGMGDVAAAVADLNTELGITGPELQTAARAALDASRVFDADLGSVIANGSDALGIFNREAEDFPHLLDIASVVAQETGASLDGLIGQVRTFGPVLKNAGFEMEEAIAFFGALEGAGIDVTRVMPGVNQAVRRLADEGVEDIRGALFGTIEQMRDATTEAEALNIAAEVFGAQGAQRMTAAVRSGALELDDLMAAMGGAEGNVSGLAEETLTLTERFQRMKNSLLVAVEPAVTQVFKSAERAIQAVEPHVHRLGELLAEWLPRAFEFVADAIEVVREGINRAEPFLDLMRLGFETIFDAVRALGEWLMNHEQVMIGIVLAIGAAVVIAFGPASIAVAAIVGAVALVGWLRQNFAEQFQAVGQVVSTAAAFVQAVITTVFGAVRDFWQRWGEDIRDFARRTFEQVVEIVRTALDVIEGVVRLVLRAILAFWNDWGDLILGAVRVLWELVLDLTEVAWNLIRDGIEAILTVIQGVLDVFAGVFTGDWDRMWQGLVGIVKGSANGIIAALNAVIGAAEAMINALSSAFNAIPDFTIPDWVPGIGGNSFGLPKIPTASLPRIPSLGMGGIVPGAAGSPQLILAHGGEEVRRREEVEQGRSDAAVLAILAQIRDAVREGRDIDLRLSDDLELAGVV